MLENVPHNQFDLVAESYEALELTGVLEEVSRHASSEPGRDHVLASEPESSRDRVARRLELVLQLAEIIGLSGDFTFGGLIPMAGLFTKLHSKAAVLDAEEILALRDLAVLSGKTAGRLVGLENRYELLQRFGDRFADMSDLPVKVDRMLDEHGMVRSSASPELQKIRKQTHDRRKKILSSLERIVQDRQLSHVVQEDYVSLRNDRYVILLKPEFKGYVSGIVHDQSRSGASVYVEPLDVVEHNNRIASLLDEEREEIRRIFARFTEETRELLPEISENHELLSELDAYRARALYGREHAGIAPELVDQGFKILGARHPLLIASGDRKTVPMDVIQDGETRATVISGANMGGKTVALKIAGLFPLMTRCAIPIPAKEGTRICPFSSIMADIGEEQDIRGRVSSFSGHIAKIRAILAAASEGDLVLLDELGGATDPDEGSALAMAILDELIAMGTRTVVTTHLTHLKAYAMGRPDVTNVSVEFHPETLQPTYRLLYDLPGESHAIVTAERLGLPESVIERAREYADRAAGGSAKLMDRLHREVLEVEERREALARREAEVNAELESLTSRRGEIVEQARREARDLLKDAEQQLRDMIKAVKSGKTRERTRLKDGIRQVKDTLESSLGVPIEPRKPVPEVGARVRVNKLGKEGEVLQQLDEERVEVGIGGLRVKADIEDLTWIAGPTREKSASKNERVRIDIPIATPRREVNLVGYRVEEALPVVDKVLDEAFGAGLSSVTVIHGTGTGRLKQAIHEHLARHEFVRHFEADDRGPGGRGVTIVHVNIP